MPCKDITEVLHLELDAADRLVRYSLTKRTCGGAVGRQSLIGKWLVGRAAAEILAAPLDEFQQAHRTRSRHWEYLYLKHFFAIRSGLETLLGRQAGGSDDLCAVESVSVTPDGHTQLTAHLRLNAMTEKIESCRGCCGSNAKAERAGFIA